MDDKDAQDLIATAVERSAGVWVELGAGSGTFTRALAAVLEAPSRIHAIDTDRRALAVIEGEPSTPGVEIVTIHGDFTDAAVIARVGDVRLDGVLAANALHFVRDMERVLGVWASRLVEGGRIVVIEYDRRAASLWVPYPVPPARLADVAMHLGLPVPRITATRPSEYSGELYVATISV